MRRIPTVVCLAESGAVAVLTGCIGGQAVRPDAESRAAVLAEASPRPSAKKKARLLIQVGG